MGKRVGLAQAVSPELRGTVGMGRRRGSEARESASSGVCILSWVCGEHKEFQPERTNHGKTDIYKSPFQLQ